MGQKVENQSYLIGYQEGEPLRTFHISSKMANRHGLIAGATGTGKTVSLRKLAEAFSEDGVPSVLVDVKGDLSGIMNKGECSGGIGKRLETIGVGEADMHGFPVRFWDVFGEKGIPIRITITEMGPLLLSRLLELNDTQEGILNVAFRVADDEGLFLFDLKDLRAILQHVAENASEYKIKYGNVSAASVGAIQRRILSLENQGADKLFTEPSIDVFNFMQTDGGRGVINIINAEKLMQSPDMFSAFFLWLLAKLYEVMPEVGDLDKPKFVVFFDEAHLIFDNASPALVKQAEQVVRLIRSKGVGIYFCTQSPLDIPESILGQLGNRVQHALRAFTPKDQKSVKAAAETFRANPKFKVETEISLLGVGEALVSFLNDKGEPSIVEKALIVPPLSQLDPVSESERERKFQTDLLYGRYKDPIDSESAFEMLMAQQAEKDKAEAAQKEEEERIKAEKAAAKARKDDPSILDGITDALTGNRKNSKGGFAYDITNNVARNMKNRMMNKIGRTITRSIMGIFKK